MVIGKGIDRIRNCDGKPSFDQIIQNIKQICLTIPNAHITLRINYDNSTFKSSLEEVLESFDPSIRPFIYIDMHRVWQTFETNEAKMCIQEENEALNAFVSKAKRFGYKCRCDGALAVNKFYGCYACKTNFACINYDGKIYKCTACSFTEKDCMGQLGDDGTIIWNEARISRLYGFSPLENEKCEKCKYLPLCMGPCPKHYMNSGYEVDCVLNGSERKIEDRIIDLYEEMRSSK